MALAVRWYHCDNSDQSTKLIKKEGNSCHTKWGTEMGFGEQQYNGSLIVISTFHASQFERVDPLLRGPQPKCACKKDMLPSDQDPKDHVKGTFSGIIC